MNKKTVLVTGGNRGIGFAVAKKFSEEGYTTILTARNEEAGHDAVKKIGRDNIHFCQMDVSSDSSVAEATEYITKNFGQVDIVVNNAAINYDTWQSTLDVDFEQVLMTINVNTLGAWRVANAFIPQMKTKGYGRIINVSSGLGTFDDMGSGTPAYSISKAGLNAVTVKLANALRGSNILVNSICPGWVRTDMGGAGASRSADEAAQDILDLSNNDQWHGKFVRYNQVISF